MQLTFGLSRPLVPPLTPEVAGAGRGVGVGGPHQAHVAGQLRALQPPAEDRWTGGDTERGLAVLLVMGLEKLKEFGLLGIIPYTL